MKTTSSLLFLAALSPAALLLSSCSKNDAVSQAAQPPVSSVTTTLNARPIRPVQLNAQLPDYPVTLGGADAKSDPNQVKASTASADPKTANPEAGAHPPAPVVAAALKLATDAPAAWANIKDSTYESRNEFMTVLNHLAAKDDFDIKQLDAKFINQPPAEAQMRVDAVAEFNTAFNNLNVQLDNMDACTAETWNDAKDRVAQAWQRVQTDHDSLMGTTASL